MRDQSYKWHRTWVFVVAILVSVGSLAFPQDPPPGSGAAPAKVPLSNSSPAARALGANDRIPVLIRSAATKAGFTDPDKARRDSVKDLQDKVAHSSLLRLVTDESSALVILEVLGRETRREVNGWTIFSGYAQNKSVLAVRLVAGGFSVDFSADGGSSGMTTRYKGAAAKVLKEVEQWVRDNRSRLGPPDALPAKD